MSDKDYAPLSAACVRALHDKIYDKRKTAALEVEKMVKEFAAGNHTGQIKRLLKVLGQDFVLSQNSHARKGGLIGLAAIAIALGKDTSIYIDDLIKPILGCLSDPDLRVRYYACESLYNVAKVSRSSVLPHFATIFSALSKIATDPDQQVKGALELLDRLLKDIVTENSSFDLDGFMPLIRERIYTKNPFARQFVINWISVLNMVPDIDLIIYLPEILDGLFKILGDTNIEVKKMCETLLGEFLRNIKNDPTKVKFSEMINIVICHASNEKSDDLVKFTAITWIKEFIQLSGTVMLPFMSGILTAILPCLSFDSEARKNIKEAASTVNLNLTKLLSSKNDDKTPIEIDQNLNLTPVVQVLIQYLKYNSIQTKTSVLKWIHHLYMELPVNMVNYTDELFPTLQLTLSDDSDQVVQQCLVVISEVMLSPKNPSNKDNIYYSKFFTSLLHIFNEDHRLLDERGPFIIRQLCVLLNPEDVYITLAEILSNETNLKFINLMVDHLNMILLTSSELFDMRNHLKNLNNEQIQSLFCCLYNTWCHNPVATVSLCFLTENYRHACELIKLFGNIEITVELLTDIDKLVQLIESPIFAYLRLELLQVPSDKYLIRALYGLLMLLPQTNAFETLRIRLSCIPNFHLDQINDQTINSKIQQQSTIQNKKINFEQLLLHFINIQEKHKEFKKRNCIKDVSFPDYNIKSLD